MPQASLETPDLALPEGGAPPHGLDAVAAASEFRGNGRLTIPLQIPHPRNGAPAPVLTLAYDSSAGNGPFGMGASIALPVIGLSTVGGVPTYTDADTVLSSEAGQLVEKGHWSDGRWVPDERIVTDPAGEAWLVRDYLPRIQDGFARITRWRRLDERTVHWRVLSADNVESRFGVSPQARIADPDDPGRTFQWLIEETVDAKGNRVRYRYKAEDAAGLDAARGGTANRYVERILYGNHGPAETTAFAFEIVFDYGEYDLEGLGAPGSDPYVPVRPWPARQDRFSSYRPGFDLRTNRLCRAVLVFNRFPAELGAESCLTAATRLDYTPSPYASCLSALRRTGYRRGADGAYVEQSLPPVTLSFTAFEPPSAPEFRRLVVEGEASLPGFLVPGAYQPVDLDGEGIPGFLRSDGIATYYYAPLGEGRYAAAHAPAAFPDVRDLADPRLTLTDIDGDGRVEMLITSETRGGFFRHRDDGGWGGFEPLDGLPTTEESPGWEFADLTGDGLGDLMTLGRTAVRFYPSLGEAGFAPARSAERRPDFPSAAANSPTERVVFADLFGDGLSHRVQVTDGAVAVWPNLGHGRFGERLPIGGAPGFAGACPASRCYFADIDGTGAADLVVAASDRLLIYRNRCGNAFSAPLAVPLPFRLGDNDQLSFLDILGNGTTAIVATRTSPAVEHWFCDLAAPAGTSGRKPYLLETVSNGCGGTSVIGYRSSASFYLADKREGRRWPTRLPFPVQLVETLSVTDGVTGASSRQRFRYHDGYYDGSARAFRGFGFVERWDEQDYAPFAPAPPWPVARVNADLRVTPGYSRTWYATGAYFETKALRRQYAAEIYRGDPAQPQLPPDVFEAAVLAAGGDALRHAYAALAGRTIRTELYADAGEAQAAARPYVVTAANFSVALVQAAGPRGLPSLLVREREAITYRYEREAADPRIEHSFALASTLLDPVDDRYRESRCTVCYGRQAGAGTPAYPEQRAIKARLDERWSTFVTAPFRMIGVDFAERALDLGGLAPPTAGLYAFAEIEAQAATAQANGIPYGQAFAGGSPQSRPARHVERYFWDDAQTSALPLGRISERALLHHERGAVFSQTWREAIFGAKLSDDDLTGLAGLVDGGDGYWWSPGLVHSYFPPDSPELFFLPSSEDSPSQAPGLFARSTIRYDAPYALLPVAVVRYVDAATPVTTAARYDYQALQPCEVGDANGIVRQALYWPLGLPLATSIFKAASGGVARVGDGDLADYVVRPGVRAAAVLADPAAYLQEAGAYFFYDLPAWPEPGAQPAASIALERTLFVSDGLSSAPIEIVVAYADGFGRPALRKRACEPEEAGGAERWLASGRTVHDGQGRAAQTYRPYYAPRPSYEPQQALADGGLVAPPAIEIRDPLGRTVRTATPKGFLTRITYGAWETAHADEDDTILNAPFYRDFMANYPAQPTQAERDEKAALDKAAAFYDTPTREVLDNAGHPIRRIADNLGDVPPDAFAGIVGGGVSSAELWSALVAAGYLETRTAPAGTWIAPAFQPYAPGFALTLPSPYDQFAAAAAALLTQGRLTTLLVVDPAGRLLEAADPRLFLADVQGGTRARSARFAYPMATATAALSDSADAGPRWQLASCLGPVVLSFDAMGRRQQQTQDGLLRPLSTVVTEADGTTSTTQATTYGEGRPDAASANLIGEVWQIADASGLVQYPAYTILGQPVQSLRRFAAAYRTAPDWSGPVPLDAATFTTGFRYDALRRVLTETLPDTSLIARRYWLSGRAAAIDVTLPGGTLRPFVAAIGYAADDSRTRVAFGNQVVQSSRYEATTGRLLGRLAERPATATRDPTLQSVDYTYDPVGNTSLVRDRTAWLLFKGGGEPEALCDYRYDALYRLVAADGLQHPGIGAETHVTGFMQSLYAELCPPDAPPVDLETYAETYAYDLSGNLVGLNHAAASASFGRAFPVEATSNRLAGVAYDANGNALATRLTGTVPLAWDARNLLAETGPFERPDGSVARDYGVHDVFGQRVRRVVEHAPDAASPVTAVTQHFIVGAYLLERSTDAATGTTTTAVTLRILDGSACMAVADTLSDGTPEVRYQLDDRLGSTSVETAQDASVLSYEAYYPYGGTAIIAGNDREVVARKLLRYSGKPCDADTGFYDYGARVLLPWQGRWLSADPSGAIDGLNLFRFVRGNPATLVDPDGRNPFDPDDPDAPKMILPPASTCIIFVKTMLFSAVNTPRMSFVSGPTNILRLYARDQAERERARATARMLRAEESAILYNVLLKTGVPADWRIMHRLQPNSWALAGLNFPILGSLTQWQTGRLLDNPDTYGQFFGQIAGGFVTTGTILTTLRRFALPGSRAYGPAAIATLAGSFALTYLGRQEEVGRTYDAARWYQRLSAQSTDIPRNVVYFSRTREERERLWAASSLVLVATGLLVLVGLRVMLPRWAAARGQAVRDWWSPRSTALILSRALLPARIVSRQRALAIRQTPPSSLMVIPPRTNALVAFTPRPSQLQIYPRQPNALQLYRPGGALQLYRPPPRALQVVTPGVTALVPFRRALPAISRAGPLGLIAAVTVGGAALLAAQQNRNRKTGNG